MLFNIYPPTPFIPVTLGGKHPAVSTELLDGIYAFVHLVTTPELETL